MIIYIPTMGRVNKQKTLACIPKDWLKRTYLVIPEKERGKHKHQHIVQPPGVRGIGPVRQWLMDTCTNERMVMMDDDLKFSSRRPGDTSLLPASPLDVAEMLRWIDDTLTIYAHAAVSTREGNNHVDKSFTEVGRPLRVLAYNTTAVKKVGARFDRVKLMEDFDMTLQLLRRGLPNKIAWCWAHDQTGSHTEGGCSLYRTPEMQAEAAHALAELHPGFVKVVQKTTKTAWKAMGGTRTDVRISWKKAYESAPVGRIRGIIIRRKS